MIAGSNGFGSAVEVYANTDTNPDISLSSLLLRANGQTASSQAAPSTVSANGITLLSVPANSLVGQNASAPVGNVTLTATILDPSSDPSIMPGGYQTMDNVGQVSYLESYGAVRVEARDDAGNIVNLSNGISATISIPLASGISSYSAAFQRSIVLLR